MSFEFNLFKDFINELLENSLSILDFNDFKDFNIKWTTFFNQTIGIIMQPSHGSCPLIAIANTMILRNEISVHPFNTSISLIEIYKKLITYLLDHYHLKLLNSEESDLISHHIQETIKIFPYLIKGLNVNCHFDHPRSFELTQEISLFDVFNIDLFHGWLISPNDEPTYSLISHMSYNDLIDLVIINEKSKLDTIKSTTISTTENISNEDDFKAHRIENHSEVNYSELNTSLNDKNMTSSNYNEEKINLIQNFLESTKTQLTYHGLIMLHSEIKERQIAVFFRNNHFNSLFCYEGQIYLLASDQMFLLLPNIIWEKLDSIKGDTKFYNQYFLESTEYYERSPIESSKQRFTDPHLNNKQKLKEKKVKEKKGKCVIS